VSTGVNRLADWLCAAAGITSAIARRAAVIRIIRSSIRNSCVERTLQRAPSPLVPYVAQAFEPAPQQRRLNVGNAAGL
jgi:hypothetical protein